MDLSKSLRLAKFASYFTWTHCLLFFENYPPSAPSMFCSVLLQNAGNALQEAQISKFFQGASPQTPLATHTFDTWKSCLWCTFFPSLPTPKLLRPTWDLIENPVLDLVWRNGLDPHMFFKLMYQWKWVGTILNFKIRPEKTSTNYCKFSFCNRYITDWNSIPKWTLCMHLH